MKPAKVTFEDIFERLENVKRSGDSGNQWMASCPCGGHSHGDSNQTLSVSKGEDGKILLHCHRGHNYRDVLASLGILPDDVARTGEPSRLRIYQPGQSSKPPKPLDPNLMESLSAKAAACQQVAIGNGKLAELANRLGVTIESLVKLGVGWNEAEREHHGSMVGVVNAHWTQPEKDAAGKLRSLQRRFPGDERDVQRTPSGQQRGLFYAQDLFTGDGPILAVEGLSDTAAAMSIGLRAVGRPSNIAGGEEIGELVGESIWTTDAPLIILGENDHKPDGSCPGLEGAVKVSQDAANRLNRAVLLAMPPASFKDLRSWLNAQQINDVDQLGEHFLKLILEDAREVYPSPPEAKVGTNTKGSADPVPSSSLGYDIPLTSSTQLLANYSCRYAVLLANKANPIVHRVTFLLCHTWACARCSKILKDRWIRHIAEVLLSHRGPLYLFTCDNTDRAWRAAYNAMAKKATTAEPLYYIRLDTQDGKVLVVSTIPYKKSPQVPASVAVAQLSGLIVNLGPCRKPIHTAREWALVEERQRSDQWTFVSSLSKADPAKVKEILQSRGVRVTDAAPKNQAKIYRQITYFLTGRTPEEIREFNAQFLEDVIDAHFCPTPRKDAG